MKLRGSCYPRDGDKRWINHLVPMVVRFSGTALIFTVLLYSKIVTFGGFVGLLSSYLITMGWH